MININYAIAITGKVVIGSAINLSGEVICNIVTKSTEYPHYTGTYNVIPKTSEQQLNTKDFIMDNNVSIEEIPYSEVSNLYGTTITIAS